MREIKKKKQSAKSHCMISKEWEGNRAAMIGSPCDFYIYICWKGDSRYSNWVKGKKANDLWSYMKDLPEKDFVQHAVTQYLKLGQVHFSKMTVDIF